MGGRRKCRVLGCESNSIENPNLRFFSFPRDPVEHEKWRENLKNTDFMAPFNSFVCIRHFEPVAVGGKQLKKGAIPTLNLGYNHSPPHSLHLKNNKRRVCCIKGCTSDIKRKYFTYPKNYDSWNQVCNIDPSEHPRPFICELHFEKKFITSNRLGGAVPTLHLPPQQNNIVPLVQTSETIHSYENKRTCCIKSCCGDGNATLFPFPGVEESRRIWILACSLNESVKDELYICACHFHKSCLTADQKELKIGAIPTLKLESQPVRVADSIIALDTKKRAITPNKTELPLEFEQHYFLDFKRRRCDSMDSDGTSDGVSFVSENEEWIAPNAAEIPYLSSLDCNNEKIHENLININSENEDNPSDQNVINNSIISAQREHTSLTCSSNCLDVSSIQPGNDNAIIRDNKHLGEKIKELDSRIGYFEKKIAELEAQSKQTHKSNQDQLNKKFVKLEKQVEYASKNAKKCETEHVMERIAKLESENELLKSKYRMLEKRAVIPSDGASQEAITFAKMIVDCPNRRYTDKEKSLAQSLIYVSPEAYDFMREELKYVLPYRKTVWRWRSTTSCTISGIDDHTSQTLKNIVSQMAEKDRICQIMFHEVDIKMDEKSGTTTTYTSQLKCLRKCCFFIVKGIFSDWKYILSYFIEQAGFNVNNLLRYLYQNIDFAEVLGLKVKAIVCDQSLCNAQIYKRLYATDKTPYILRKKEKIHCFFDYFHLSRCIRNNFLNYDIQTIDGLASFKVIKKLYRIDKANLSLALFPKLTPSHLCPDTVERLNISLAAQLLSHSVAVGIEKAINQQLLGPDPKILKCARATKNFVQRMNDLFDEFDLRDQNSSYRTKINNLKDHLTFLYSMEQPNVINAHFTSGLILTTKAMINFCEDIFENYKNLDINLLSKFNQDALNSLFSELFTGKETVENDIQAFVASSRREFEQKYKIQMTDTSLKLDRELPCDG